MSPVEFTCYESGGNRVLECSPEGALLRDENDAVKLIGAAFEHGARCVAIPVSRLGDDFFQLSTRIAGGFIQKFVTYEVKLMVFGDISAYTSQSPALRDFVYECNAGDYLWFVADREELEKRLSAG